MQHRIINPPIHRCSSVLFPSIKEIIDAYSFDIDHSSAKHSGVVADYSYGNFGSPTYTHLCDAVANTEGGRYVLLYPSGLLSLVVSCIAFTSVGAHVLVSEHAYFKLHRFARKSLQDLGRSVSFYESARDVPHLINDRTSLIMIESLSSTNLTLESIPQIVECAKKHNIVTVCDNTCAPLMLRPLEHNADIAVYSMTKYFSGHSDVLMGATIMNDKQLFEKLYLTYRDYGIFVSSDDCYLVNRGISTMEVRMQQSQATALALATKLQQHRKVQQVIYPGLPSHPQHTMWQECTRKKWGGGLVNLVLDRQYALNEVDMALRDIKIFKVGLSWGGCSSMILPTMNGRVLDAVHGVNMVRVFCGLEDRDSLIESLESFLSRLQ